MCIRDRSSTSLKDQIILKLNALESPQGAIYTGSPPSALGKITITQANGFGFEIFDSQSLLTAEGFSGGTGIPYDQQQGMDAILHIPTRESQSMSNPGEEPLTVTWTSGVISLVSHPHGVFIRESSLGRSAIDSLGKHFLRRVPLRSDYGEIEYDDVNSSGRDYLDVSGLTWRYGEFRLTDELGTVIPLGSPWSFSLCFSDKASG